MRQGRAGLSENPSAGGTSRAKSVDGNIFAAFARSGTDRDEEEDISEDEPVGASKRATKAPGAPKPRRVKIPPPGAN